MLHRVDIQTWDNGSHTKQLLYKMKVESFLHVSTYRRSYGEMAHTHILVEFSILRFSIISIVHIPFHIFWNSQFLNSV